MFRKAIHIFIAVLLLTATTGLSVSEQCCGDTLVKVSLYSEAAACCDDQSDNCCQDVSEYLQIDQEFLISSFSFETDRSSDLESAFTEFTYQNPESDSFVKAGFSKHKHPITLQRRLAGLQKYLL